MPLNKDTLLQGGKYKIVRHISNGGFGVTYEAEHVLLHKRLAIKEFFVKDFCNRDEETNHVTVGTKTKVQLVSRLKRKFLDEAVAISSLNHPNIVKVSDVFEENGTAYYVMNYIDGSSLNDIIKKNGAMSEDTALRYIRQLCEALKYIHGRNRLHLDIKPGNIMIDEHDNAILIDFGTSKQYDEEDGENTSTLLGKTPGYAPIEQMGNSVQTFTPATDIYSLGGTLYKMLTGITPPEANILVADDESLKLLPSYITAETRNAVKQAMRVNRKERPQKIENFVALFSTKQKKVKGKPILPSKSRTEFVDLLILLIAVCEFCCFGLSSDFCRSWIKYERHSNIDSYYFGGYTFISGLFAFLAGCVWLNSHKGLQLLNVLIIGLISASALLAPMIIAANYESIKYINIIVFVEYIYFICFALFYQWDLKSTGRLIWRSRLSIKLFSLIEIIVFVLWTFNTLGYILY